MGRKAETRRASLPAPPTLCILSALLIFVPPAAGQDAPQFHSSISELVVLPVVVTNRDGGFVTDLTADKFAVYDNGRRQTVTLFSNEDTPVTIALVIDESGSMRGKIGQVVAATLGFARSSNPEDEMFVIAFNDHVRHAVGERALSVGDAPAVEAALATLTPTGQTALYDALTAALDRLEHGTHARRIIVLMSDGGDNASRAQLDGVLERARRGNVTIYTIGLFERGAPDTNPGVLEKLAETTGGERYLPGSPGLLLQACHRIAREIRTGYTLGYVPPDRDGNFHRVSVMIEGAEGRRLQVRTRPGYFAARAVS